MDAIVRLQRLTRQQLAFEDGVAMLNQTRAELRQANAAATAWAYTAIAANAAMIPLNCIVNAFELAPAKSLLQNVLQVTYQAVTSGNLRNRDLSVTGKALLTPLKSLVGKELARKSLQSYTPGVNIIFGLAEDSMALASTMQQVDGSGSAERDALVARLDRQILAMTTELNRIRTERVAIGQRLARTA